MKWNNNLKKEIPLDWEVVNLKDICSLTWGQCPDGKNILDINAQGSDLLDYCSGAGDMKGGFLVDCQAKTDKSKRQAHKYDILVSVAGKIGDMCVVDRTISLGRAALACSANTYLETAFLYCTLKSQNKKLTTIATGSIQKVINNDHINTLNFAYSKQVVSDFGQIAMPIFEDLMKIAHENKKLVQLRNWLLPMLMNGQATID